MRAPLFGMSGGQQQRVAIARDVQERLAGFQEFRACMESQKSVSEAAGAYGVCSLIGFTAEVGLGTVLGASLFSSAVGIFFGIYPARKAVRLSSIDALRHE